MAVKGVDSCEMHGRSTLELLTLLHLLILAVLPLRLESFGRKRQQLGFEESSSWNRVGASCLHPQDGSLLYFYQLSFPCQDVPEAGLFSSFLFCSVL